MTARDQLLGKIQKQYGISKEEAERQVSSNQSESIAISDNYLNLSTICDHQTPPRSTGYLRNTIHCMH
jgi:hypothetical protein